MSDKKHELTCSIVTPEKAVFETEADAVTVYAFDGEVGIMPGHAPLVAKVGLGQVTVFIGNEERKLVVDGGFLQVNDDKVTVLTTRAALDQDIDRDEAEKTLQKIKDAPEPKDPDDFGDWQDQRTWAEIRERIAPPRPAKF